MTTLEKIEEMGFSLSDKICVFCSNTMESGNLVCLFCGEYKGILSISEAVDYYGIDILPV